jgi:hypothetical protein
MRSRAKLKMIEKAEEKEAPRRGVSLLMLILCVGIRVVQALFDVAWSDSARRTIERGCAT